MRQKILTILLSCVLLLITIQAEAKFGSNKRSVIDEYAATITTRGVIILNKKLVDKYLKDYDWVEVDYNYGNSRIALKPVVKPSKNSLFLTRTRKGKVSILIRKNLLKRKGANIKGKKYFICVWNSDKGVIVIDYSHPVTEYFIEGGASKKRKTK